MKIGISVTVPSTTDRSSIACHAELECDHFNQTTVDRMVETARQCESVVRQINHGAPSSNDRSANASSHQSQAAPNGAPRLATEKQVKAIRAMAGRMGINLASVLPDRFGVSGPAGLSIRQASTLIDELKQTPVAG
jgi:hypothetical protein